MKNDWRLLLAGVALATGCRSSPESAPGASLVEVSRGAPPSDYRLLGSVSCRETGSGAAITARCENVLRGAAHEMDADLVVVEREESGTACQGCVSLHGTAYRRELPYERARPTATRPTFTGAGRLAKRGSGTGFAVTPDGTILTAHHVIDGARTIVATLSNGDVIAASVAAKMKDGDIALLRVSHATPSYLTLGEANALELGQPVFTLGFPVPSFLGMEPKFSEGAVSARIETKDGHEMLQVTVPIQPGNSGGPLVTEDAQVVGVISSSAAVAPFFRSTGTLPQGINFAVSAEPAKGGFHAPPALPKVTTRHDAIERTTGALCFVESIVGDGLLLAPTDFGKSEVPLSPPGLDARLRDCESGDAEACLAAALGIVSICAAKNTPACGDLRYAKTVAIHACNVGREEACRVLRDRN